MTVHLTGTHRPPPSVTLRAPATLWPGLSSELSDWPERLATPCRKDFPENWSPDFASPSDSGLAGAYSARYGYGLTASAAR